MTSISEQTEHARDLELSEVVKIIQFFKSKRLHKLRVTAWMMAVTSAHMRT